MERVFWISEVKDLLFYGGRGSDGFGFLIEACSFGLRVAKVKWPLSEVVVDWLIYRRFSKPRSLAWKYSNVNSVSRDAKLKEVTNGV